MKKFWLHPEAITILILSTTATVLIIGYNYWGWFSGEAKVGADGFPAKPKAGDEFVKDGARYKYTCTQVECITAPCPPECAWQAMNDAPSNKRIISSPSDRITKENLINSIINKPSSNQRIPPQHRGSFRNELSKMTVEQLAFVNSNQPVGLSIKEVCEYVKKNTAPWIDCSWA